MTSPLLRLSVALVRLWTRAYTWGMEPFARATRRAEIESDLWESQREESDSDAAIALRILARLFGGMHDDLRWRIEEPSAGARVGVTLAIAAAAILAAGVWVLLVARPGDPPVAPPPPAPAALGFGTSPPPPPPPPPPPQAFGRARASDGPPPR